MRIDFVSRHENALRLLLIFSGWSCDSSLFDGLTADGWDIAVAYDYTDLDFDRNILADYSTVRVVAWSLGVVAAATTLAGCERISDAVAVNGTLTPVDDEFGIPAAIYQGTAANLDRRNLTKFRRRMAGDAETFTRLFVGMETDDTGIENLRRQLTLLEEAAKKLNTEQPLPWRRAYVSDNDRIFPPENVHRAWSESGVETVSIPSPHIPDFNSIIRAELPDYRIIGEHFAAALPYYDTTATVQVRVAADLMQELKNVISKHGLKQQTDVLEFGAGSGLLTRQLASKLQPRSLTVVDLVDVGPFKLCPNETYCRCDAETWLAMTLASHEKPRFDLVVSSSTLQWLSDLHTFLHDCRHIISSEGLLAFSIYTTGNLHELDALRPAPLRYHTSHEIEAWLESDYTILASKEDTEMLTFDSPRKLIEHLKQTGVSGSAPTLSPALSAARLRHIRTLTYHYAIIIARPK